ncbi:ATP-binding protein [Streptacidiphilus sp. PB12-B1b]|uniref:ATP-binding protein n=1 Tax=Streptacidiphilus sp. PB12-B1b TaxID=2705012 RepID=UPI0015FA97E0|nr:ATP-binding protein [Streptacidiphilus sp. PB12-B1b]QMU77085.1 ATP-binding protein [Streptacidiphilus sp. PB12-B1b]
MEQQTQFPARHAVHAFDGRSGTITAARELAQGFFERCRPPLSRADLDDALLLVSELVTNAVRHAPGPCTLTLADDRRRLTVTVTDSSSAAPVGRAPDLASGNGGFGWHLLHRIAQQVVVEPHEGGGKSVTATLLPPTT